MTGRLALFALLALQALPAVRPVMQAVQIPVVVRDGNRLVRDLQADDFVVSDAGVIQDIQAVSAESIAVDVTLIVSGGRGLQPREQMAIAEKLDRGVQQIAKMIGPRDALRVLRIDTFVEQLRPMLPVTSESGAIAIPRDAGVSSVHDALAAALMRHVPRDRRHFIVAITDAIDTMSFTTAARVRDIAARSEAFLELVVVNPPAGRRQLTYERPRFFEFDEALLTEAAAATGGELRGRKLFGTADPTSAFKRVFDEFKQSYVLRFTPRDVPVSGWHELSVSIPRKPGYTIRARPGYFAP
jgi:hypothetical protein